MKRALLLVLTLLLLLAPWQTLGACKPFETVDLRYPKSMEADVPKGYRVKEYTEVAITIPYDRIARTERWLPHESPAAMPLTRAIELATRWLAREHSDDGEITVWGAYLARYGCPGAADYWYYGVGFWPFSLGDDHFKDVGASVVVLMDGTVIGPVMVK